MTGVLDRLEPARGVLRITRHPVMWGVGLWAAVHLVANGDLASLLFFGGFLLTALGGAWHLDRRLAATEGERWRCFVAVTSFARWIIWSIRTPWDLWNSNSQGGLRPRPGGDVPRRNSITLSRRLRLNPGRASEDKTMGETKSRITVFYDGACPSCVRDRERYVQWAGHADASVCWFDITGQEERLRELRIDPRRALTELHVMDEHQRIYSELDAYILLLDGIPRLKPLAWLIGQPWVRPWLARLYHGRVNRRLRRSGRLG
jgi:predicted DCC family thiol-disulfide oxidoreductase YuxK